MKGESSRKTIWQELVQDKEVSFDSTYRVIADTDSGGNVSKTPKAALHEVDSLFFEILEFLAYQSQ